MSAVQSKLSPITVSCREYVHPWTEYCAVATAGLFLQALQESFRIYSAVYTFSLLMRFRIPSWNDLRRTFLGILQSTAFLTTSAFTYSFFLCFIRQYVGSFNFFTASFVPAFMSSVCALLIERPSRRGLLCLYVSNVATETLFNMLCSRGYCRPIPYGQVLIFGASISILLYYFRRGLHQDPVTAVYSSTTNTINNNTIVVSHTNKDSIYDILRFVVGRHEECIPTLQLQPQYLSRRRERSSATANLIVTNNENRTISTIHSTAQITQDDNRTESDYNNSETINNRFINRQPINNIIKFSMQIVQYYTKLVDYFKYRLPRHRTCPHTRNSCLHYVISGGAKLFSIGLGLQMTLSIIRMKMTSKQPWLQQLKQVFSNRHTLNLGIFLGGFAVLFRMSCCSFRHIFGKDDPLFAIPCALIASIAFASYPDKTVALYVFWKALQISYNIGIDAGYLPKIPHFTFLLYATSTATLFHAASLEPTNLRSSYWKFLHNLSGGRMACMNRLPLDVYGLKTSLQLEQVLAATKTTRNLRFSL